MRTCRQDSFWQGCVIRGMPLSVNCADSFQSLKPGMFQLKWIEVSWNDCKSPKKSSNRASRVSIRHRLSRFCWWIQYRSEARSGLPWIKPIHLMAWISSHFNEEAVRLSNWPVRYIVWRYYVKVRERGHSQRDFVGFQFSIPESDI